MSSLSEYSLLDRGRHSSKDSGPYQPVYQTLVGHNFAMPNVHDFQPRRHHTYHSLSFDMLPRLCFSQMDCISDCSTSGNDCLSMRNIDVNDYLDMDTEYRLQSDHPSYGFQQQEMSTQQDTLEPYMLLRQAPPVTYEESAPCFSYDSTSTFYPSEAPSFDAVLSSYNTSEPQEQYFTYESQFSPANSEISLSTPSSKYVEEEEEGPCMDKPYARLIYEALMQAPGHSMMLRDIYDWFVHNTSKPRESGSNGWQNSIRHNLSMNQAFENDKSDTSTRGHPRKANSIWILTDHAVKHGVQSTTRYRKSGTAKKGSGHRTPATERQKSGSKGGKAARRAALLRRQEEVSKTKGQGESAYAIGTPPSRWLDNSTSPDHISTPRYCPATPVDNCHNISTYALPQTTCPVEQSHYLKQEQIRLGDESKLHHVSDSFSQDFTSMPHDCDSFDIMFS